MLTTQNITFRFLVQRGK